jgi:hypothetical protein
MLSPLADSMVELSIETGEKVAIARTVSLALLLAFSVAPLAQAQSDKPLFIAADMVRDRGGSGPTCVLTSRFLRKEGVVWRIRVQDATGKELDDKSLNSVVVELSDGQKFEAHFKGATLPPTISGRPPGKSPRTTRREASTTRWSPPPRTAPRRAGNRSTSNRHS